jgi:hypothetical protein
VKTYNVYRCPSVQNYWPNVNEVGAPGDESNYMPAYIKNIGSKQDWMPASYAYAGFLYETAATGTVARPRRHGELKNPVDTIMIFNTRMSWPDLGPWMLNYYCDPKTTVASSSHKYGAFMQHFGRIPSIFCDGHVRPVTLRETVTPIDMWQTKAYGYDSYTLLTATMNQMADEYK